ncbi:MAG: DUF3168 domain-containing protein [Pseudomonadota bacterium]|nr:DUF3168 domain-containing protein [Pseudomonadota bacterium]
MSYAIGGALQAAVYQHLSSDPALTALVGDAIYDALPTGTMPDLYVMIGEEDMRDRSDVSGHGALHFLRVSVVTEVAGFASAKAAAAVIADRLSDAELTLERGRLVGLWFERASARRIGTAARMRRIDLRFRARVEDN